MEGLYRGLQGPLSGGIVDAVDTFETSKSIGKADSFHNLEECDVRLSA